MPKNRLFDLININVEERGFQYVLLKIVPRKYISMHYRSVTSTYMGLDSKDQTKISSIGQPRHICLRPTSCQTRPRKQSCEGIHAGFAQANTGIQLERLLT